MDARIGHNVLLDTNVIFFFVPPHFL